MRSASNEKVGATGPGRLSLTYSRVPHQALRLALVNGMPKQWAALFMLCSFIRKSDDGVLVSCPREMICKELGLTEPQVKNAVDSLKEKGLLSVSRRGRNGRATLYALNLNAASETYPGISDAEAEPETRLLEPTLQAPYRGSWSLPLTNCSKEQFVVRGVTEDDGMASKEPPFAGGSLSGKEEFPPADIILPVSHEEGESLASISKRGDSR